MNQEIFNTAEFYKAVRFTDLSKSGPDDFAKYLTFATKEEYLAWRHTWREVNKLLVQEIKAVKARLHQPHTADTWRDMGALVTLKHRSTSLRFLRMASRRRAGVQADLARQAKSVA